jgi:ABC-type glycerol-3-phosphate transport system substrate-binding protein
MPPNVLRKNNPTVLIVWHNQSGTRERSLLDLVDRWNLTNPYGSTIVLERRDNTRIHQALLDPNRNAIQMPALILGSPMQAATYYQKGLIHTLDVYLNDFSDEVGWTSTDRNDLFPYVFSAGRASDGSLIGIPFAASVRVMLFNRDWLRSTLSAQESIPTNWNEFTNLCNKISTVSRGAPCFAVEPTFSTFQEWTYAHAPPNQPSVALTQPAFERLMGFMSSGQAYRVSDATQYQDDFIAARVPFIFDYSNNIENYRMTVKKRANFDIGVGLLPSTNSEQSSPMQNKLWMVVKSGNSAKDSLAWQFIRWISSTEQTVHWALTTGDLPVRISSVVYMANSTDVNLISLRNEFITSSWVRLGNAAQPAKISGAQGCIQSLQTDAMRQIVDRAPINIVLQSLDIASQSLQNTDCSIR